MKCGVTLAAALAEMKGHAEVGILFDTVVFVGIAWHPLCLCRDGCTSTCNMLRLGFLQKATDNPLPNKERPCCRKKAGGGAAERETLA